MKYEYSDGVNYFCGAIIVEGISHRDGLISVDVGPVRITMTRQEAKRLKDRLEKVIAETRPANAPDEPDVTTKAYQEFAPETVTYTMEEYKKFLVMYRHAQRMGNI